MEILIAILATYFAANIVLATLTWINAGDLDLPRFKRQMPRLFALGSIAFMEFFFAVPLVLWMSFSARKSKPSHVPVHETALGNGAAKEGEAIGT